MPARSPLNRQYERRYRRDVPSRSVMCISTSRKGFRRGMIRPRWVFWNRILCPRRDRMPPMTVKGTNPEYIQNEISERKGPQRFIRGPFYWVFCRGVICHPTAVQNIQLSPNQPRKLRASSRSCFSWASMESPAIGRASKRFRPIGFPDSLQYP